MQTKNNYIDRISDLGDSVQEEAIKNLNNCVLLACPGAGKTNTLVLKIAYLLNEIIKKPRGLACITLSNNAAKEFKDRLKKLNINLRDSVFFGTVHSFCLSEIILPFGNQYSPELINDSIEIASKEERSRFLEESVKNIGLDLDYRNLFYELKKARDVIHLSPKETKLEENIFIKMAREYERLLRFNNLIDFEDIILISLKIIDEYPLVLELLCSKYPWLIVDEYQDLGEHLHKLVIKFIETKKVKLFAVGDPNQSILGFNGAKPEYLLELSKRKDIISLKSNNNYRSCQEIIDASSIFIAPSESSKINIISGKKSVLYQECPNGKDQQLDIIAQNILPFIYSNNKSSRIAVLLRSWYDVNYFRFKLENKGFSTLMIKSEDSEYDRTRLIEQIENLAKWCSGGHISSEPKFDDIYAFWSNYLSKLDPGFNQKSNTQKIKEIYLKCENLKVDQISLKEWIEKFEKLFCLQTLLGKINKKTFGLKREIKALNYFYNLCINSNFGNQKVKSFSGLDDFQGKIVITTMHGSKGMQFDKVIMPMLEEGVIPSWRKDEDIGEAKRLFYVSLTRAKEEVYLLWSGFTIDRYGRKHSEGKSRFVSNLIDAKKIFEIQTTLNLIN